jgi:hypothetical protein
VVPAYLKGPAATWWMTNQALPNGNVNKIIVWTDGNANDTNFTINFLATFRSQTLVERWTTELEQRCQQPGENVDTYAVALQELYRRVEYGVFNFSEVMKARKFVNGLLPDLYINVKPYNNQTWIGAVDRAKSYELIYQDQTAVMDYINKYTPATSNSQINVLNDAVATLTQQISQMAQILANQTNPNQRTVNFQPRQNQQLNREVCFSCRQPRYIKRNCLEFVTPNVLNLIMSNV